MTLVQFGNVTQPVQSPLVTADADLTQLITVATSGTPVQGPAKTNAGGWWITADPTNLKPIRFMFHGQTAAAKGFPLDAGDKMFLPVSSLASVDFDVDSGGNGSKVWACKA